MVKITVNGQQIEADPKKPLIHACHTHDVDVPMYCYHPGLSPVGSCRICQVEVKQGEAPGRVMVACRTYPAEGMVVDTESPKAHETRRECLEFLLKNHPLDCPICDKAGECDLQDFTYAEGQAAGRTHEPRRPLEKRKSLGDTIVLDEERCILCSRCVRFFEEIPKQAQLTVSDLGSRSVISTFMDKPLKGKYQGNIADLCPVGALTLTKFRFQARVWNLTKMASTCGECSRGCSTTVEVLRGSDVKRIRPRENLDVNGWWICDIGRFAFSHINAPNRLEGSLVREVPGLSIARNEDALCAVRDMMMRHKEVLFLVSPWLTVEEGQKLLDYSKRFGSKPIFVSPEHNSEKDTVLHTGDPCPNRRGLTELGIEGLPQKAAIERMQKSKCIVLLGERIVELIGASAVEALPHATSVAVFDCHALDLPQVQACVGIANSAERTGTWVNIDGVKGPIAAVKPTPRNVRALERHLDDLVKLSPSTESMGARAR
ncbi:MAG: (2Fe-2S)-binding protein [Planctomycetes bacterium]|nr:(2Fe-2S)-binding protein [Planctomycetota bacterium]